MPQKSIAYKSMSRGFVFAASLRALPSMVSPYRPISIPSMIISKYPRPYPSVFESFNEYKNTISIQYSYYNIIFIL